MNQDRKNWLRKFAFGAGLTLLSFLTFGCALTKAIRHPFTPPAMIQEALPPAPVPAPSFSILHPFTPAPAPVATPKPVPVKLSSGQTVLMIPATPAAAPATYYAPAPVPVKTAVAKAIDYLLWLIWIGGLLAIAAGVACIVWLGQMWLGVKLIICAVGGIVVGTWFAVHYQLVIGLCLVAGVAWIVLDHFVTWGTACKWIDKQEATIKENL